METTAAAVTQTVVQHLVEVAFPAPLGVSFDNSLMPKRAKRKTKEEQPPAEHTGEEEDERLREEQEEEEDQEEEEEDQEDRTVWRFLSLVVQREIRMCHIPHHHEIPSRPATPLS